MKFKTTAFYRALFLALSLCLLPSCGGTSAQADEAKTVTNVSEDNSSLWSQVKSAILPTTYNVPEGTRLEVRLSHAVSSDGNSSGDAFTATLEKAIQVDGRLLAPRGAAVSGTLQEVEDSKRVKGRARLVLALHSMEIDGKEYSLSVHPLTIRAAGTKERDAIAIGASSAVGAVIGAIAGGGDDAAKGAAIGAGAGTGYVLLTKGKEVRLGAETPLEFTLSTDLDLPVDSSA